MAGSAKKKRKGNGGEAKAKKVSAYFNFCSVNRENVKKSHPDVPVNKALSLLWKSLSDAEKAAFSAEPFPSALETLNSAGAATNTDNGNGHGAINEDDDEEGGNGRGACGEIASVFPHARVKRIIKLDREIRKVSAEVVSAVASAAQLFVEYLSEGSFRVAAEKKHRTIRLQDVKEAVGREGRLSDFLEGSLSDLGQDSDDESDASDDQCKQSAPRTAASAPAPPPPPPVLALLLEGTRWKSFENIKEALAVRGRIVDRGYKKYNLRCSKSKGRFKSLGKKFVRFWKCGKLGHFKNFKNLYRSKMDKIKPFEYTFAT